VDLTDISTTKLSDAASLGPLHALNVPKHAFSKQKFQNFLVPLSPTQ